MGSRQNLGRWSGDPEIQPRDLAVQVLALVMLSQAEKRKTGNIHLEGCGQIFMQTENMENVVRFDSLGKEAGSSSVCKQVSKPILLVLRRSIKCPPGDTRFALPSVTCNLQRRCKVAQR